MVELRKIEHVPPHIICELANNYKIAINLRDIFPYPYTHDDAVAFIELAKTGALGLEKIGFEKEAIIKLSVIKEGRIFDEYIYSIRNI